MSDGASPISHKTDLQHELHARPLTFNVCTKADGFYFNQCEQFAN